MRSELGSILDNLVELERCLKWLDGYGEPLNEPDIQPVPTGSSIAFRNALAVIRAACKELAENFDKAKKVMDKYAVKSAAGYNTISVETYDLSAEQEYQGLIMATRYFKNGICLDLEELTGIQGKDITEYKLGRERSPANIMKYVLEHTLKTIREGLAAQRDAANKMVQVIGSDRCRPTLDMLGLAEATLIWRECLQKSYQIPEINVAASIRAMNGEILLQDNTYKRNVALSDYAYSENILPDSEKAPIYVVVADSKTMLYSVTKKLTNVRYNYAYISFDESLERMYGVTTAGFTVESLKQAYCRSGARYAVDIAFAPKKDVDELFRICEDLYWRVDNPAFSGLGQIANVVNQPVYADKKHSSGELVASLLKKLGFSLTRQPSQITPDNLLASARLHSGMDGLVSGFNAKALKDKTLQSFKLSEK